MGTRPAWASVAALWLVLIIAPPSSAQIATSTSDDPTTGLTDGIEDVAQTAVQDAVETTATTVNEISQATTQSVADSSTAADLGDASNEAQVTLGGGQGGTSDGSATGSDGNADASPIAPGGAAEAVGDPSGGDRPSQDSAVRGKTTGRSGEASTIRPLSEPVSVTKMNDANQDGRYSDTERAVKAGDPVSFAVRITNTGGTELYVVDLMDSFGAESGLYGIVVCPHLSGEHLGPGASLTCRFTLDDYSPKEGVRVNLLRLTASEVTDQESTISVSATSTVVAPNAAVLGLVEEQEGALSLAGTGAALARLAKLLVEMLLAGVLLLYAARLLEQQPDMVLVTQRRTVRIVPPPTTRSPA